ncbi:hypothetical protein TBLA_0B08280 [Henningerozyma blattae CBS 6284]|uniref:Uncharacterized protein n=1 Tax=Henningerozyma blattae (strain ATCC 34711 / CBS 6284 / DSM 70876 / NBRC 10599 / NRRL Y-10934 / UCD 77-7) TaxID=1071380 RepID=I2GZU2_HENB6|nr:hypothetical protein TBLA_0B08280 [Tetrapisispora blattae CBS 6284]CCH59644.1 hypothetical protein TBLA_0B08280 [Tetrapisispora blattae CBS 6284]
MRATRRLYSSGLSQDFLDQLLKKANEAIEANIAKKNANPRPKRNNNYRNQSSPYNKKYAKRRPNNTTSNSNRPVNSYNNNNELLQSQPLNSQPQFNKNSTSNAMSKNDETISNAMEILSSDVNTTTQPRRSFTNMQSQRTNSNNRITFRNNRTNSYKNKNSGNNYNNTQRKYPVKKSFVPEVPKAFVPFNPTTLSLLPYYSNIPINNNNTKTLNTIKSLLTYNNMSISLNSNGNTANSMKIKTFNDQQRPYLSKNMLLQKISKSEASKSNTNALGPFEINNEIIATNYTGKPTTLPAVKVDDFKGNSKELYWNYNVVKRNVEKLKNLDQEKKIKFINVCSGLNDIKTIL